MQSQVKCRECGQENLLETKRGVVIVGQRCSKCDETLSLGLSRRWFLGSMIGLAASAALPAPERERSVLDYLDEHIERIRPMLADLFNGDVWDMAEHQIMIASATEVLRTNRLREGLTVRFD